MPPQRSPGPLQPLELYTVSVIPSSGDTHDAKTVRERAPKIGLEVAAVDERVGAKTPLLFRKNRLFLAIEGRFRHR